MTAANVLTIHQSMQLSLLPTSTHDISCIDAICIGSGRFLRAVLVPALLHCQLKPIIIQTRGRTFMDYCQSRLDNYEEEVQDVQSTQQNENFTLTYEVDTVHYDGTIQTDIIPIYGAGTLGSKEGKEDLIQNLIPKLNHLSFIGIGVTEAGLSSAQCKTMQDLSDVLEQCYISMILEKKIVCTNPNGKINIVCTDNVPNSGDLVRKYMIQIAQERQENKEDQYSYDENKHTSERMHKKQRVEGNNSMSFLKFLKQNVTFHNTMVDRITSQRDGSNGMVPRAEPTPAKALVIEDLHGDLPKSFCNDETRTKYGVVVRTNAGKLASDIALKLRVANGTHTAVAHLMALSQFLMTDILSSESSESSKLIMTYLDALFEGQILPAAEEEFGTEETKAVYDDWRRRLIHGHFGLSTFFITQNGAAKGGIRIGPTVCDLWRQDKDVQISTAFAFACILRFLTPINDKVPEDGKYTGWLDGFTKDEIPEEKSCNTDTVTYADGLCYNLKEGWYEFRCSCLIELIPLPLMLAKNELQQPNAYVFEIQNYLLKSDGGNLVNASSLQTDDKWNRRVLALAKSIATLYSRMVAGDGILTILKELSEKHVTSRNHGEGLKSPSDDLIDSMSIDGKSPLHYRPTSIPDSSHLMNIKIDHMDEAIRAVVFAEVASVLAIDLHTHLLPPSHGALCLWGIDELLTYHYLVAEYFMIASPKLSPQQFYNQTKQKQADIIWKALFLDRTPLSEACRGVITTLTALGLQKEVVSRDLKAIRTFYKRFRDNGQQGADEFCNLVYQTAGIQYAIMTNIPFDQNEAQHWKPKRKDYSTHFRSALRVDPLLCGDTKTIERALVLSGLETTIDGAKQYLNEWIDVMKPEYMMASTPHDFVLKDKEEKTNIYNGPLSYVRNIGVNEEAMKVPGAFADLSSSATNTGTGSINNTTNCNPSSECNPGEEEMASLINEDSNFLSDVLMKVCEERDLPIALKIGAHRGVNPNLGSAGDGLVAFADSNVLARLCTKYPKVRFLVTFLSRNNQHEACVLCTKFQNLHLYGCWWFCNNPSIIKEITKMRIEMLGTAFTAQHSDARVLDQLIYKWSHSRAVIADVLVGEIKKLMESGWSVSRGEIRRDVKRLFGGSYEDFMEKSFIK